MRHSRRAATPFVTVDAKLDRGADRATIDGVVHWNSRAVGTDAMRIGEVRAVAIDADSGLPTILGETSKRISATDPSDRISFDIDKGKLDALRNDNRVVVTATQHPSHPEPPDSGDDTTERSYVALDQLQSGPGRGRVGSVDCADRPIGPQAGVGALRFCDLVGAALGDADLSNSDMRMGDLTAVDLRGANLSGTKLDGSRLAGARASDSRLDSASLIDVRAPELVIRSTVINRATFFASALRGARFDGSNLFQTSFGAAGLGGDASFADANLDRVATSPTRTSAREICRACGQGRRRCSSPI